MALTIQVVIDNIISITNITHSGHYRPAVCSSSINTILRNPQVGYGATSKLFPCDANFVDAILACEKEQLNEFGKENDEDSGMELYAHAMMN